MKLRPSRPYRLLTQAEQKLYQAHCRLAAENGLHYLLHAQGLVPAYRHWTESGAPFAIISAETRADPEPTPPGFARTLAAERRRQETHYRNQERAGDLRTRLKDSGQGYLPAWGVWSPAEGQPHSQFTTFVPGIDRKTAVLLGCHFDQEVIVWGHGGHFWQINPRTGAERGPLSTEQRLRRLRLPKELEPEAQATGDAERWRFLFRKDLPLTIACTIRTSIVEHCIEQSLRGFPSAPRTLLSRGQWFWFWRAGGGIIICGHQPCGYSVHGQRLGPRLTGCDDGIMIMSYLDAYLPLWPTPETEAEIERLRARFGP